MDEQRKPERRRHRRIGKREAGRPAKPPRAQSPRSHDSPERLAALLRLARAAGRVSNFDIQVK